MRGHITAHLEGSSRSHQSHIKHMRGAISEEDHQRPYQEEQKPEELIQRGAIRAI
jgi:hypothetical protein